MTRRIPRWSMLWRPHSRPPKISFHSFHLRSSASPRISRKEKSALNLVWWPRYAVQSKTVKQLKQSNPQVCRVRGQPGKVDATVIVSFETVEDCMKCLEDKALMTKVFFHFCAKISCSYPFFSVSKSCACTWRKDRGGPRRLLLNRVHQRWHVRRERDHQWVFSAWGDRQGAARWREERREEGHRLLRRPRQCHGSPHPLRQFQRLSWDHVHTRMWMRRDGHYMILHSAFT